MSGKEITHEGIVQEVRDDHVIVSFITQPACSSCSIKNHCSLSETEVKNLEVQTSGKTYQRGEKVLITLGQSNGFKAVFLGYFFPFIILFTVLVVLLKFTNNEALAGLISISCLVPYYLILWILRGKINESFKFRLLKVGG
jgi:sigma-E factor negative regulatory protein RseC